MYGHLAFARFPALCFEFEFELAPARSWFSLIELFDWFKKNARKLPSQSDATINLLQLGVFPRLPRLPVFIDSLCHVIALICLVIFRLLIGINKNLCSNCLWI